MQAGRIGPGSTGSYRDARPDNRVLNTDSPIKDLVVVRSNPADQRFCSIPDLAGPNYVRFLETLHATLRPARYLELGAGRGETLRAAKCPSISVDPALAITGDATAGKPACFLFAQTSDAFFREFNPATLLGGPIDLAFLDGPRLFERMLREFAATERHCHRDSVILLHDCVPTDTHVARRVMQDERLANQSVHSSWWAGDVWKAAALIQRYRPDLRIHGFNTPPTGLIAITNLDPKSKVVDDYYFALVQEAATSLSEPEDMLAFFTKLDMRSAEDFSAPDQLSELFVFS